MGKTHLATGIEKTEYQSQYDEYVKELLGDKQVLARIMKYTIEEFSDLEIDKIMGCIEGEPEVSTHPLKPGKHVADKITGMNNESNIIDEGEVTFDIRFYAMVPGKTSVKIIINVEAQKNYHVGYCIGSRGVFYCARMISEQLDTEFSTDNYDDLKKVYSIWICMDTPSIYSNTISKYEIQEEEVYGHFTGEEKFDYLSVVIIRLLESTNDKKNELIDMLNILLSMELDAQTKKELLVSEYGMKMTREMEGKVNRMCNLSELIVEKTTERVTERVSCERLILSVEKIMKNLTLSLEKACEVLDTTMEEYYNAREYLNNL